MLTLRGPIFLALSFALFSITAFQKMTNGSSDKSKLAGRAQ